MTGRHPRTDHPVPAGVTPRGTLVVVPGRGQSRATYGRFGRRLAADGYEVRVVDAPAPAVPGALAAHLDALEDRLRDAVTGAGPVARPLVLVGADTGAAALAALADRAGPPGGEDRPAALVLAGLPGAGPAEFSTWDAELDARTTCPVHRGTLTEDPEVAHGSFAAPVPDDLLDAARAGTSALPHLILAGDRDPLTDQDATALLADKLPRARLGVVHGAHHDVLDDQQHRTVAAEIVTFLESLRAGLAPLLTVETSAW